jgi:CDP-diacylglycerol--glycerol-3-phosphate 3-phosphatidyltransferase
MLNAIRPALARVLDPVGRALARTPVTPNALTVIGTVGVCAGALSLFPIGELFAGTMVCWFFTFADMLDGTLARIKGTSGPWGAFLDSTLDRIADASVFGGLTLYFMLGGHSRLLAGVALFCLVSGALVSYAKARAEGLGYRCDVGIAERSERLLIGLVAAGLAGLGVPYVLAIGLWALAALSAVTFFQRVLAVRQAIRTGEGGKLCRRSVSGSPGWPTAWAGSWCAGSPSRGRTPRSWPRPTSAGGGRAPGFRCWRATCAG